MKRRVGPVTGAELMEWTRWELVQLVKELAVDRDPEELRTVADRVYAYCQNQNRVSTARCHVNAESLRRAKAVPGRRDSVAAQKLLNELDDLRRNRALGRIGEIIDSLPEPEVRDALRLIAFRGSS